MLALFYVWFRGALLLDRAGGGVAVVVNIFLAVIEFPRWLRRVRRWCDRRVGLEEGKSSLCMTTWFTVLIRCLRHDDSHGCRHRFDLCRDCLHSVERRS